MAIPTQTTAEWPLQQKIFSALDGSVTDVDGNAVPVYDALPRNSKGEVSVSRPFVLIGDSFPADHSTKNTRGEEILQRIPVESTYQGWREAKEMKSQVVSTLDSNTFDLTADDFKNYHARYNDATPQKLIEQDTGRVIRRITIEFIYLITNL